MNIDQRPVSILILACVYLAIGVVAFAYHFPQLWRPGGAWVEVIECMAIIAGVFMLKGRNWARWLALAWAGFHVILSAFHTFREAAVHSLLFAIVAWFLFRPAARRYFGALTGPT